MPNQLSFATPLDRVFFALADPTRRAVVQRLSCGPLSVGELAKPFDMALPSFVQHLKVLEHSGLLRSRKTGRVRVCEIAPQPLADAENWLNQQRALWTQRLDQLDSYLLQLHAARQASAAATEAANSNAPGADGHLPDAQRHSM
mgnify:CR=1 FL=1